MRHAAVLLMLTCLAAVHVGAADPKAPAPPVKLVAAKAEYERAVEKSSVAHLETIQKAATEYRKQLALAQDEETKAGNLDAALAIRGEIRRIDKGAIVAHQANTKEDLAKVVESGEWNWNDLGPITFKPKGVAHTKDWELSKIAVSWEAIDRRTVRLLIGKGGSDGHRSALLVFSESLDEYTGFNFEGVKIQPRPRFTAPPK